MQIERPRVGENLEDVTRPMVLPDWSTSLATLRAAPGRRRSAAGPPGMVVLPAGLPDEFGLACEVGFVQLDQPIEPGRDTPG